MAFFGCFGEDPDGRRIFNMRAEYLFAPMLHYSMDGVMALCYSIKEAFLPVSDPWLFVATAGDGKGITVGRDTVRRIYRRYGKRLYAHIPFATAFAVYDSRKGKLFLGGTRGETCFIEQVGETLFFSSDPLLLRSPSALEFLTRTR